MQRKQIEKIEGKTTYISNQPYLPNNSAVHARISYSVCRIHFRNNENDHDHAL
jgi:hypothetical protein